MASEPHIPGIRRPGRPKADNPGEPGVRVVVLMTVVQAKKMDAARGHATRAEWIRRAVAVALAE